MLPSFGIPFALITLATSTLLVPSSTEARRGVAAAVERCPDVARSLVRPFTDGVATREIVHAAR